MSRTPERLSAGRHSLQLWPSDQMVRGGINPPHWVAVFLCLHVAGGSV